MRDAGHLSSKHVDFFDSLLVDLVPHADLKERAELAERLSLLGNAPRALVRQMARDNEILIAGAAAAPLECDRRERPARHRARQGAAASAGDGGAAASVVRSHRRRHHARRPRDVVRRAAGNAGARFSGRGYAELVRRAGADGVLTLAVRQRADLSKAHLKTLLAGWKSRRSA
ncbi:DUF2336 domain-containing protein [Bradyrhizobium sp.]|uniref:DUF2336 domain-containing protein n=1 Tax=Bradyrhizobium sp. TaxID=376 RepID=UPI003F8D45F9